MAITLKETFTVEAPIARVWAFVMQPQQVATCIPGASLDEVVDERNYVGSIKIKVGAVTAAYKGRVQFTEINEQEYRMTMTAEGKETGGGIAKGGMVAQLRELPGGKTEVVSEANVELTGKIMQVGRGMIEAVSHQLFLQFVSRVKSRLETAEAASSESAGAAVAGAPPSAAPAEDEAIKVFPLLLKALLELIKKFFRRLFGGAKSGS